MIPNFGTKLGQMLGEKLAERFMPHPAPRRSTQRRPHPLRHQPPRPLQPEAPVAEAGNFPAESYAAPAEASAEQTYTAPEPTYPTPEPAYSAPVETSTPTYDVQPTVAAEPVAAPVVAEPAVLAAPAKSAEEIEEERLWGEVDTAWAAEDYGRVTQLLDQVKALQPEDAADIDQKIAAAQYNAGTHLEQTGELARALYLYQDAQRRDPNLGRPASRSSGSRTRSTPPPSPLPLGAAGTRRGPCPPDLHRRGGRLALGDRGAVLWRWQSVGPDRRGEQRSVPDPNVIQPGQVLTIPRFVSPVPSMSA